MSERSERGRYFDPPQRAKIIKLYLESGLSQSQLALRFNTSCDCIHRILVAAGIKPERRKAVE